MLILKCPKCKQKMKYQSRDKILLKKKKECVYCGRNFSVNLNILKS